MGQMGVVPFHSTPKIFSKRPLAVGFLLDNPTASVVPFPQTHMQSTITRDISRILIIPFTLKNAVFTFERSSGRTSECSYPRSPATRTTPLKYDTPNIGRYKRVSRKTTIMQCAKKASRKAPAIPNFCGTECKLFFLSDSISIQE